MSPGKPEILLCTGGFLRIYMGDFCNAGVAPVLLDDVREDAGILTEGNFDMVVTTINHVDDVKRLVKKKTGGELPFEVEMVVMSPGRLSISQVAKIYKRQTAVLIYQDEWYLYSMKRYLRELAMKGRGEYVRAGEALSYLEQADEKVKQMIAKGLLISLMAGAVTGCSAVREKNIVFNSAQEEPPQTNLTFFGFKYEAL